MSLSLTVQRALDEAAHPFLPSDADLTRWAEAAFAAAGGEGDAHLTVRLVETPEITRLNRDYRHKDRPTNVLSFPFAPPPGLPAEATAGELGDIVVCAPVVEQEAAEQGKPLAAHWAHMLVHGTLHLLGYDHVSPAEAAQMEPLELRALAGLGIGDPYAVADATADAT